MYMASQKGGGARAPCAPMLDPPMILIVGYGISNSVSSHSLDDDTKYRYQNMLPIYIERKFWPVLNNFMKMKMEV